MMTATDSTRFRIDPRYATRSYTGYCWVRFELMRVGQTAHSEERIERGGRGVLSHGLRRLGRVHHLLQDTRSSIGRHGPRDRSVYAHSHLRIATSGHSHLPVPTLSRTQRQGMPAYGALCQSSVVQTIATIYGFQCGRAINSSAHRPKANESQSEGIGSAVQVQARTTQLGVRAEIRNNW